MPKYLNSFTANFFQKISIKFKYLARIINFLISNKVS